VKGTELMWDYADDYTLTGIEKFTFTPTPKPFVFAGAWEETDTNETWYNNTEGTGFCGYLVFCQLQMENPRKLIMKNPADRQIMIEYLQTKVLPNVSERFLHGVRGAITQLLSYSLKKVLRSTPSLPQEYWLPSSFAEGGKDHQFMVGEIKAFLWLKTPGQSCYRGQSPNSSIGIDDGEKSFTGEWHSYWKWQVFLREPYKHIYYRDVHYFMGPDNTEEVRLSEFSEAFDDIVHVLVQYFDQN